MVEDFSAKDKASGIKFCTVVHQRPGQGISHFGELCSPRRPKSDESASVRTTRAGPRAMRVWPLHWPCVELACMDRGQSPLTYLLLFML